MDIKKLQDIGLNLSNPKVKFGFVVTLGFLVVAGAGGGYFYFHAKEKAEEQRLIQSQKQQEASAKSQYEQALITVGRGLDSIAYLNAIEKLRGDTIFLSANGWKLESIKCTDLCDYNFIKDTDPRWNYVELVKNKIPYKPTFEEKQIQFSRVDVFQHDMTELLTNVSMSELTDAIGIIPQCDSALAYLYSLKNHFFKRINSEITLPSSISSDTTYPWQKLRGLKYGEVKLESSSNGYPELFFDAFPYPKVIKSFDVNNGSKAITLNYICM